MAGRGYVQLAVRTDPTNSGRMIIADLGRRDQIALLDNIERGHVRALVEELRCRVNQHPVLLCNVQETIWRKAGAVWNLHR